MYVKLRYYFSFICFMKKIILTTLLIISCSPEESEYVFPVLKLPKITIETEDIKEIDSKENYIDGTFKFVSNDYDFDDFEKPIVIRGRGNSTWQMPKKTTFCSFLLTNGRVTCSALPAGAILTPQHWINWPEMGYVLPIVFLSARSAFRPAVR